MPAGVAALVGVMLAPVGGEARSTAPEPSPGVDLAGYSRERPAVPVRVLFIHHSCGGQLLAEPGEENGRAACILDFHPNGGGLRKRLESQGYEVHEASYGSALGESTDLFDWLPKFKTKMDQVLRCSINDEARIDGLLNQVVMFKSCYPNSRFLSMGDMPGDPAGFELTVWNAKAAMAALLELFSKHPGTLFVYWTAPPNAPKASPERAWKWLSRKLRGKPSIAEAMGSSAALARTFNDWVKSPNGWLRNYPLRNVVAYDYFDVLTDHGTSNLLRYPTENGYGSHPSREGQTKAAEEFVPFLNSAVRRAGITP